MDSRVKLLRSVSNSSSVIDATLFLPEKLQHPVWNLYAGLALGDLHLSQGLRISDEPSLHDPRTTVGSVDGG
jgi:hypothetical protein